MKRPVFMIAFATLSRYVTSPSFGQIERNDAERPFVLPGDQVADDRVAIRMGRVARTLELIGKELRMFIDRKEVAGPGEFQQLEDISADVVARLHPKAKRWMMRR